VLAANTDSETHASSRERACVRRALVAANFTRAQHASRGMARAVVLPGGKISEHDLDIFHITDSPAEVVEIVTRSQSSLAHLDSTVSDEIRLSSL